MMELKLSSIPHLKRKKKRFHLTTYSAEQNEGNVQTEVGAQMTLLISLRVLGRQGVCMECYSCVECLSVLVILHTHTLQSSVFVAPRVVNDAAFLLACK